MTIPRTDEEILAENFDKIKDKRLRKALEADTKEGYLTAFVPEDKIGLRREPLYDGSGTIKFRIGRFVKCEVKKTDSLKVSKCLGRRLNVTYKEAEKGRSLDLELYVDTNGQISYFYSRQNSSRCVGGTLTGNEAKAVLDIIDYYKD